jgi:hypothetical protein
MADDFDSLYAEARKQDLADEATAHQVIGEQAVTNEQQRYQDTLDRQRLNTSPTWTQTADNLKQTAAEVGHNTVQAGEGIYSGLVHGAAELTNAGLWLASYNTPQMLWEHFASTSDDPYTRDLASRNAARLASAQNTVRGFADAITPTMDTTAGKLTNAIGQYVIPFIVSDGATSLEEGAPLAAQVAQKVFAGGAAQSLGFNPHDPRLSNLLSEFPVLKNPVTDYLASKPGDTEADGRLKNFLEGGALTGATEAIVGGFSAVLKGMRATKALNDGAAAIEATPSTLIDHPNPQAEQPGADVLADINKDLQARVDAREAAEARSSTTGTPTAKPSAATPGEPAAATAGEPQALKPWTPETVENADTAHPTSSAAEAGTSSAPTFSPQETAQAAFSVPAEKSQAVLDAINSGKYNAVAGVLDDTHRTIPWETLSDGANLKGLFNAVEDNIGDLIKDAHGVGPVTDQSIEQLARDIGGDVTSLNRLYSGITGEGGLAARITAGYNIMTASARQLRDLAANVTKFDPKSPEGAQALLDFQKQLNIHGAIVGQVRQSSAEIGRALHAHRTLKASSDVALSNLQDYANNPLGVEALKKLAKTVTDAESNNLKAITNVSDAVQGRGFWNVVREVATNGMLSGPKTWIKNAVGLIGKTAVSVAERYVSAAISDTTRLVLPGTEQSAFREAWAHTMGMGEGIRAAWKLAAETLKSEDFVSPFAAPAPKAIFRSTDGRTGGDLALSKLVNITGTVIRYPGRLMSLMDHFSQAQGYYGDLNARAYVQSATEADAQGLTADARDSFIQNRMAELKASPLPEMQQQAMNEGRYNAFLEDARTDIGPMVAGINRSPLLKLIIAPFTHRPGNLLRQGMIDYTPASLFYGDTRESIANIYRGTADSDDRLAMARMFIGTSLLLEGWNIAQSGHIKGNGLGASNTQSLDGVPKYSIKFGDSWYRYDNVDPVGQWLGIAADLHDYAQHHWDPNNDTVVGRMSDAIQAGVHTLSSVALDKTFLSSVRTLVNAMAQDDPDKMKAAGEKFVSSNVAKFVPFSGALGAAAQATDPTQRVATGDLGDAVLSRIPGASQDLTPRRDLLGRPTQVNSWWNPLTGGSGNADQMDSELSKLELHINAPPRTLFGYQMTPREYDEILTNATASPVFPGGQTLEQYLREQTSTQAWADRSQSPQGISENAKMVQDAINTSHNYGVKMFEVQHPNLLQLKVQQQQDHFKQSVQSVQRANQALQQAGQL